MRKAKKKTRKADDKLVVKPAIQEPVRSVEEDKPFDFGGIPDRDLKKNLGCG